MIVFNVTVEQEKMKMLLLLSKDHSPGRKMTDLFFKGMRWKYCCYCKNITIAYKSHRRGQWLATMAATPWFGGSNPSDNIEL